LNFAFIFKWIVWVFFYYIEIIQPSYIIIFKNAFF
jgi:hypothetical protein